MTIIISRAQSRRDTGIRIFRHWTMDRAPAPRVQK